MSVPPEKTSEFLVPELTAAMSSGREPNPSHLSSREARKLAFSESLTFWLIAWLGTAVSGGVFGVALMLLMVPVAAAFFLAPLIVGFFIAGCWAIPFLGTVAIVTWGFWLTRFRMITAAVAGGWTGVMASRAVFTDSFPGSQYFDPIFLACVFGAVGCPLFTYWFGRKIFSRNKKREAPDAPWQFTLRDLFVHFTVLAVLISLWSCYFTAVRSIEKNKPPAPIPATTAIVSKSQ